MQTRVCKTCSIWVLVLAPLAAGAQEVDTPPNAAAARPKLGDPITNRIGMKLIYIPPGKLVMGSPADEIDRFDDEQQHEVEITKGFFIGKYEVTQDEYQKVAGKNPSLFRGPKLPVESVSWKEAKEFCRLLSLMEQRGGKDGRNENGYRLPTEAEWELACRAGTKTPYYFGESISPKQANYSFFNVKKNATVEIGRYPPNAWGLHDMCGNVWEWCEDTYAPDIHENSNPKDPNGPLKGSYFDKAIRGGSWGCTPRYCRSAARYTAPNSALDATRRAGNVGFRIVLPFPHFQLPTSIGVFIQNEQEENLGVRRVSWPSSMIGGN